MRTRLVQAMRARHGRLLHSCADRQYNIFSHSEHHVLNPAVCMIGAMYNTWLAICNMCINICASLKSALSSRDMRSVCVPVCLAASVCMCLRNYHFSCIYRTWTWWWGACERCTHEAWCFVGASLPDLCDHESRDVRCIIRCCAHAHCDWNCGICACVRQYKMYVLVLHRIWTCKRYGMIGKLTFSQLMIIAEFPKKCLRAA